MQITNNKSKVVWNKVKKFLIEKQPFIPFSNPQINLFDKIQGEVNQIILPNGKFILQYDEQREVKVENLQQLHMINSTSIDNTGNLYWPAEEILAYFLVKNLELISEANNIIELGAGKSGLAALSLLRYRDSLQKLNKIIITDGNQSAVQGLQKNIQLNKKWLTEDNVEVLDELILSDLESEQQQNLKLQSGVLEWEIYPLEARQCDQNNLILIADCLFFEKFHQELLSTILHFLNYICLIACPRRGGSMNRFIKLAEKTQLLQVTFINFKDEKYQSEIDSMKKNQEYDEDRHDVYFIMIKLKN